MKTDIDGHSHILGTVKERISEPEDRSIVTSKLKY